MSSAQGKPDVASELEFAEPLSPDVGDAELRLDALLSAHSSKPRAPLPNKVAESPLDRLRRVFKSDLIPVAEELHAKYAESGLLIDVDASDFLSGGRRVSIVIEFRETGLRLDGTVMPDSIAFQQTRYTHFDRGGLAASGPTLRARTLDTGLFRDFLCERITNLVHAVVGRRR